MNSILQTIFSEFSNKNVSTDEYSKSYADFISSKMEPFNACKVLIAAGIDSYNEYSNVYGELYNNFPGKLDVMLSDGTVIAMNQINQLFYYADYQAKELCQEGEDIYDKYYDLIMTSPIYCDVQGSLNRTELYLQDVVEDMANISLTNDAYQVVLQSINSDTLDTMGIINRVTSAIKDKYPTSDSISSAVDRVISLINEASSGRVLLQSIIADLSSSFLINDDGNDEGYVITFNDESILYKLTGCSPAAAWWSSLSLNIDWSDIADSLKNIGITFYKGCLSFFSATLPSLINKVNRFVINKWTGREIFLESSDHNNNAFQIPLIDCTIDNVPTAIAHFCEDDQLLLPYQDMLQGLGYENSLTAIQSILTNVSNTRDTIFNNDCFTIVMNRLGGNPVDESPEVGHAYHLDSLASDSFNGRKADYFRMCFVNPNELNGESTVEGRTMQSEDVVKRYATMDPSSDKIASVTTVYPGLSKDCFLPRNDETFPYRLVTFKLTVPSKKKYGLSSITVDLGACGHLAHSTLDSSPGSESHNPLISSGWSSQTSAGFSALEYINEITGGDGISGTSTGICTIYNDGKISFSPGTTMLLYGYHQYAESKINQCDEDKDYAFTATVRIAIRINPSDKSIVNASVKIGIDGIRLATSSWVASDIVCDGPFWTNLITAIENGDSGNVNALTEVLGLMFRHGSVTDHVRTPWIIGDVSVYAGSWSAPDLVPGVLTADEADLYPVAFNAVSGYWMHDIGSLRIRVFPKILHWPSSQSKKDWTLSSLYGSFPRIIHNSDDSSSRYEGSDQINTLADYFEWIFNEGDDSLPSDATDKELTLAYAYNAKRALLWLFLLAYGQSDDSFMNDNLIQACADPTHIAQVIFEFPSSHFVENGSLISRHFEKVILANTMTDTNDISTNSIFIRNNVSDLPSSNIDFLRACGMTVDSSSSCGITVINYGDILSSEYTKIRDKKALERILIGAFLTCGLMHDSSRLRLASYGDNTLFVPYKQGVFNMSPKYLLASDDDSRLKFVNFLTTCAVTAVVIGGGIAIGVSAFRIGTALKQMTLDIAHLGREYSKAESLPEKKAIYKRLCALSRKKKAISGIQSVFGLLRKPFSMLAGLISPKDKDESEMDSDVLNMISEINNLNKKIGFQDD